MGGISGDSDYVTIDNATFTSYISIDGEVLDFTNSSVSGHVILGHNFVNMTNITISSNYLDIASADNAYLSNVTVTSYLSGTIADLRLEDVDTGWGYGTLRVGKLWMSNSTFEKSSNPDNYYIYVSDLDNTNNASTSDIYIYNSTIKFNANSNSGYTFRFDVNTTGDIRIIDSEINSTHFRTSVIELEGSDIQVTNSTLWSGTKYTATGCYHQCNTEDIYSHLNIYGGNLTIKDSLLIADSQVTGSNSDSGRWIHSYSYVDLEVDDFVISDSSLISQDNHRFRHIPMRSCNQHRPIVDH